MRSASFLLLLACAPVLRAQDAAPGDTVVTASGQCDWTNTGAETIFVLHDNVAVVGNGMRLTCDLLNVLAGKMSVAAAAAGPASQLQKARQVIATGHVKIVNAEYVATCGRAEMFPQESRVVLTENPVVNVVSDHSTFASPRIILAKNAQGHWSITTEAFKGSMPGVKLPETKTKDQGSDLEPAVPAIAK